MKYKLLYTTKPFYYSILYASMEDFASLTSKDLKEELKKSDEKYQQLCQKRDELNQKAKLLRDERNMLNDEKKKLTDEMKTAKKMRDDLVTKMKQHKVKRTEYQQQARELIKKKRDQRGKFKGNSMFLRAEELKLEIRRLEYEQETVPMKPKEEERTVKEIKEKKIEYERVKAELGKQQTIEIDLDNLDKTISQLFEMADKEHAIVVKIYQETQDWHTKFIKTVDEISNLINESNQKHREYLETKMKADEYHKKTVEMRSMIINIRKERKERYEAALRMLEDSNVKARALLDEDELDKIMNDNIEKLKKDGKISIGL